MMSLCEKHVLTEIDDIRPASRSVIALAESAASLSDDKKFDIELIVKELLSNSFIHAKPSRKTPVVLIASVEGEDLIISVTDEGEGFKHDKVIQSSTAAPPLCESGRGLFLVRSLCSDMKYNFKGNSVEVKVAL